MDVVSLVTLVVAMKEPRHGNETPGKVWARTLRLTKFTG